MSKKIAFNTQEYLSLRSEIIQRILLINSQSHTAILTIITAFGAGLTLNYDTQIVDENNIIALVTLNIIRSIVFLVPIFYLAPLSVKSGENLIQLASLSAYIRVFYDYLSLKDKKMNWETSNNILSNANVDKGKRSYSMKFYNEEYTVLSLISFVLYTIFTVVSVITIKSHVNKELYLIIVASYILLGISSLLLIWFIHKNSGVKNTMMKYTPIYVEGYIKRAIEMGVINDIDINKVKEELNPYREIKIGFWY